MTLHIPSWICWFVLGGIAGVIIQDIRWKYRVWIWKGGESSQQPSEKDST